MASFFDNFREAMNLGQANHVTHLSDISPEQQKAYRDRYVDAASRNAKASATNNLRISNARDNGNYWTSTGGDFSEDWNSPNYETRIYGFEYRKPQKGSRDGGRGSVATGRVLVRVPKNRTPGLMGGRAFDVSDQGVPAGDMGVYGAYLDDGTALSSGDFEDLMRANPYGGFRWTGRFDSDSGEYDNRSDKKMVESFNERQSELEQAVGLPKPGEYRWSHNFRGWRRY